MTEAPKRNRQPEHALQVLVKKWVRENVLRPHVFLAFDRAKKTSILQHIRERARGQRAGTPDTVLLIDGAAVWVELKSPIGKVSDTQDDLHREMARVGFTVGVCRSVESYAQELNARHIELRRGAFEQAAGADRMLAAAAAKPKAPPMKCRRPVRAKATPRALAVLARARNSGVVV